MITELIKRPVTSNEFKQIALAVLIDFDRVCRENCIEYSIGYGTLLGAIRHKGFIPWDDDIDVIMLPEEYEKFVKCRHQLQAHHKFISVSTDLEFTAPLAKIYSNKTVLHEYNHQDHVLIGVYIDLFVFDYIPANYIARKMKYLLAYTIQKFWERITYQPRTKLRMERWLQKKAITYGFGRRASLLINEINKRAKKSKEASNLMYNVYGYKKDTFPVTELRNLRNITFENLEFSAFCNYSMFLHRWYGDFMALPSEENRISNHNYIVYHCNSDDNLST